MKSQTVSTYWFWTLAKDFSKEVFAIAVEERGLEKGRGRRGVPSRGI